MPFQLARDNPTFVNSQNSVPRMLNENSGPSSVQKLFALKVKTVPTTPTIGENFNRSISFSTLEPFVSNEIIIRFL